MRPRALADRVRAAVLRRARSGLGPPERAFYLCRSRSMDILEACHTIDTPFSSPPPCSGAARSDVMPRWRKQVRVRRVPRERASTAPAHHAQPPPRSSLRPALRDASSMFAARRSARVVGRNGAATPARISMAPNSGRCSRTWRGNARTRDPWARPSQRALARALKLRARPCRARAGLRPSPP